jgi:hypothetical protein
MEVIITQSTDVLIKRATPGNNHLATGLKANITRSNYQAYA